VVVCGHKARGRIKRGLATSGAGMALTGLILGYLAIAGVAAVGLIGVIGGIAGYRAVQAQRQNQSATGRSVPVITEPANPQRGPRGDRGERAVRPGGERTPPAANRPANRDPQVTTDPATATIPATPAAGTIGQTEFKVSNAEFNPNMNTLRLQDTTGGGGGKRVTIFFFPKDGETVFGRTWTVSAGSRESKPHVHFSGAGKQGSEMQNYAMRLEWEQPAGSKARGKLYLELPTSTGLRLAGTFEAEIKQ
jgi:hypothetical protein